MEKLWKEEQKDGFRLIRNEGGKCLGLSDGSRVKLITVDGLAFKDFLGTGELAPYETGVLMPGKEPRIWRQGFPLRILQA